MTRPAADTLEREKEKLWITDSELVRWMGVPEKQAYEIIRMLDAQQSGFPRKQKAYGDRRYKAAVKTYFDRHYGTMVEAQQRSDRR
jgi:hypothetical protein